MSKEFDKCHCSWPDCTWLSEQIELHAPEGHVWKGNRHRWKEVRLSKRTMFERMLFLAAMCQHVPGIEEAFQDGGRGTNRKEICLARHHFPIVVYDFLGTRRITTLVKGGQMDFLVERDGCQRLADECNRVRELVTLLKDKILMPGKLREAFVARENEFVSSKGKLFICAPVAPSDEVIDILKTFQRKEKRSSPPKQPSPVLPSSPLVDEEEECLPPLPKQPSPVLPSSPSSPMIIDEEKECLSPLPKQSSPVPPSIRVDESSLLLLGMAAELPDAEMSPSMVPSIEECVTKIQSKVKLLGLENARHSRNFITSIRLLRFFYSDYTAIPLMTDDDERTFGYLHPCKNDDAKHKACATFQITSTIVSKGLYCSPCQLERMTNRQTNSIH